MWRDLKRERCEHIADGVISSGSGGRRADRRSKTARLVALWRRRQSHAHARQPGRVGHAQWCDSPWRGCPIEARRWSIHSQGTLRRAPAGAGIFSGPLRRAHHGRRHPTLHPIQSGLQRRSQCGAQKSATGRTLRVRAWLSRAEGGRCCSNLGLAGVGQSAGHAPNLGHNWPKSAKYGLNGLSSAHISVPRQAGRDVEIAPEIARDVRRFVRTLALCLQAP